MKCSDDKKWSPRQKMVSALIGLRSSCTLPYCAYNASNMLTALPFSQAFPSKPGKQLHLNELNLLIHVPPFKQGSLPHSLKSAGANEVKCRQEIHS